MLKVLLAFLCIALFWGCDPNKTDPEGSSKTRELGVLALNYLSRGEFESAKELIDSIQSLDPLSPAANAMKVFLMRERRVGRRSYVSTLDLEDRYGNLVARLEYTFHVGKVGGFESVDIALTNLYRDQPSSILQYTPFLYHKRPDAAVVSGYAYPGRKNDLMFYSVAPGSALKRSLQFNRGMYFSTYDGSQGTSQQNWTNITRSLLMGSGSETYILVDGKFSLGRPVYRPYWEFPDSLHSYFEGDKSNNEVGH